jgi:hypothetical protein
MRTLLAVALVMGGTFVLHAPVDSAEVVKKRSAKPRPYATTAQRRTHSREEVECERARNEDPGGLYAGYPCWARAALGSSHGNDRE